MIEITLERKGPGMEKAIEEILGKMPKALDTAGSFLEAKMVEKINSNIPPELNPKTIKRKGSSLALVDTGELIGMVSHETDGLETKVGILSNTGERAFIGMLMEYGAPAIPIPERSFERSTFNEEKDNVVKIITETIK